MTGWLYHANFQSQGMQQRRRSPQASRKDSRPHRIYGGVGSTGIGGKGDEPVSDSLGELMEGLAFSAGMATDLALVEDQ